MVTPSLHSPRTPTHARSKGFRVSIPRRRGCCRTQRSTGTGRAIFINPQRRGNATIKLRLAYQEVSRIKVRIHRASTRVPLEIRRLVNHPRFFLPPLRSARGTTVKVPAHNYANTSLILARRGTASGINHEGGEGARILL